MELSWLSCRQAPNRHGVGLLLLWLTVLPSWPACWVCQLPKAHSAAYLHACGNLYSAGRELEALPPVAAGGYSSSSVSSTCEAMAMAGAALRPRLQQLARERPRCSGEQRGAWGQAVGAPA